MLPDWLSQVIDEIVAEPNKPWDADDGMDEKYVHSTPAGRLVNAYLANSSEGHLQLCWLTMFAARRALPCWQLYCDSTRPIETVQKIKHWLESGCETDWDEYVTPERPAFHGVPIIDCRASDTSFAASAAAHAARFASARQPIHAIYSLADSDGAFDVSPVGSCDNYREWFLTIAVPGSLLMRDLSAAQKSAFQDYDIVEIVKNRESEG